AAASKAAAHSSAVGVAQSTTRGQPGDSVPDFVYNSISGDVRFGKDGVVINGSSRVSTIQILSASGQLLFNSSHFTGPTDVNSNTNLSGADFTSNGFAD